MPATAAPAGDDSLMSHLVGHLREVRSEMLRLSPNWSGGPPGWSPPHSMLPSGPTHVRVTASTRLNPRHLGSSELNVLQSFCAVTMSLYSIRGVISL